MNYASSIRRGISEIYVFSWVALLLVIAVPLRGQQPGTSMDAANLASAPVVQVKPFHESYSELTLRGSTLQMVKPELADKADVPGSGFIRERYEVSWRPKDLFDLYVIRPRGVSKPPVVMYLYSFPDDTEKFKNSEWCEMAVRGGYAAVGFVGAVAGHRMRFRPAKEWFVSEMPEALASTTHDIQMILDYLATRDDLDSSRVGIFASGSGASSAILASAVDPRIAALDLLGPWSDWPKWLAESKVVPEDERPSYLNAEFLSGVAPLEPVHWLSKVKAKIVRIQDIRTDTSFPASSQEKLEAAAPPFAVINQFGNRLSFLTNERPITLYDWIKEQLKPGSKFQVVAEKSERVHFFPAVDAPKPENWPNVKQPEPLKPPSASSQNATANNVNNKNANN
jgi:hypothetical protein